MSGWSPLRGVAFLCVLALGSLVAAPPAAALTTIDVGYLDRDTTWGPTGVPADSQYLITTNLRVDEGFTLTVQPGTTLRFASGVGLQVGTGSTGTLRLLGTGAQPVVLRPDSNTAGDWTGVRFTATAEGCEVQHARIEKATVDVTVEAGADVEISASELLGASQNGLKLAGEATPSVTGTTVAGAGSHCVLAENQTTAPAAFSGNTVGPCGDYLVKAYPRAAGVFGGGTTFVRNTAPTERNAVYVEYGTIGADTTWPALTNNVVYYAPYGLLVSGADGPVWTVGDGAVIKMGPAAGGYSISIGNGTANGSGGIAAEGVTFTSYRDDSVGGDTTADGETQPAAGDYSGLTFREYVVAGSYVRGSDLRWCGYTYGLTWNYTSGCFSYYYTDDPPTLEDVTIDRSAYYGINITASSPVITGTAITRSANVGIYGSGHPTLTAVEITDSGSHGFYGGDATVAGCTFERNNGYGFYGANVAMTGTTFADNAQYPVAVAAGSVAGVAAPASGNVFVPNTAPARYNAVDVLDGTVAASATWPALPAGFVYHVAGTVSVTGAGGPVLTLAPGVIVKMGAGYGVFVIGSSNAVLPGGLVATGVTFTSYRDDTVAGDSTGDGASVPAPSDFGGVIFREYVVPGSALTELDLTWCGRTDGIAWNYNAGCLTFYYTNNPPALSDIRITSSYYYGVRVTQSSPTFQDLVVTDAGNACVYADGVGTLTLDQAVLSGCGSHGLFSSSSVVVSDSAFEDNAGYGLYATSAVVTGSHFEGNASYPLGVGAASVAAAVGPGAGNAFEPNAAPARFNAVDVLDGTITADATWPALADGLAYRVGGVVTVAGPDEPVLTIGAGAVVKGGGGGYGALVIGSPTSSSPGGLVAEGVTFTSYRDDSVAGDTTGDGLTSPAAGDFAGVVFREYVLDGSHVVDSTLRWCGYYGVIAWNYTNGCVTYYYTDHAPLLQDVVVERSSYYGVRVTQSSPTLSDVAVRRSADAGLYADGTGALRLYGGTFADNAGMGAYLGPAQTAIVAESTFARNGSDGLHAWAATVTGSTFEDNGRYPVAVWPNAVATLVDPASGNTLVPNVAPERYNTVYIQDGTLTQDALWPALADGFSYYVPSNLSVSGVAEPVLTIEDGAVVKLGGASYGGLVVGSSNSAQPGGIAASGVVFTSYRDDELAGDTTGNGDTAPARGDHAGLIFREYVLSGSSVANSRVSWCGYAGIIAWNYTNGCVTYYYTDHPPALTDVDVERSSYYGVRVTSSNPTFVGGSVRLAADAGIYHDGTGTFTLRDAFVSDNGTYGFWGAAATISGTTFAGNGRYPVRVTAPSVAGVAAPASSNVLVPNVDPPAWNAIAVATGTIDADATWPALPGDFSYFIEGGAYVTVSGAGAPVWTIEPGALVKLPAESWFVIGGPAATNLGELRASGVTITAASDDSIGGDTPGDGVSNPAPGAAGGILFREYAVDDSFIEDSVLLYGGGGTCALGWNWACGAVTTYQSSPTLRGTTLRYALRAVEVHAGSAPSLQRNAIDTNTIGVHVLSDGAPVLRDNNLQNNTSYAVQNEGSAQVDAIQNWWGSPSGPYHPTNNPAGAGDTVSDRVTFDPWLTTSTDTMAPQAVRDLRITALTATTVTLAWTAPGDDLADGQAVSYDLRYATAPITGPGAFAAATPVAGLPAPGAGGAAETFTVPGLNGGTTYWFALRATDDAGNTSLVSNNASNPPPALYAVTPGYATAGVPFDIVVQGAGFLPGARLTLTLGGTTFTATGVTVTASRAEGHLDVSTAAEGLWTLALTNGDGKSASWSYWLYSGFSLQPGGPQVVVTGETLQFVAAGGDAPFEWASTDPTVGTVDASGLFTAVSLGEATVTYVTVREAGGETRQSGAITVPLDFDQDGVRDRWEVDHGYDPRDGADATADDDGDGLTTREEATHGTDPAVFDPSLRVRSTPAAYDLYVDGDAHWPGRPVGRTPALVVDDAVRTHTLGIAGEGIEPWYGAADESAVAQVVVNATLADHETPAAFLSAPAIATPPGDGRTVPYVVDLDRDGALDLVVGASDGHVYVQYGFAGAWTPLEANGSVLDAGGPASAAVADWDGDGRADLLVGGPDGRIRLYVNEGSDTTPAFGAGAALSYRGGAGAVTIEHVAPVAFTLVDWDADGAPDLLVGDGAGGLWLYLGDDAQSPRLAGPAAVSFWNGAVAAGRDLAPFVTYDWDGDGRFDLVLGALGGAVMVHRNIGGATTPAFDVTPTVVIAAVDRDAAPVLFDHDGDGVRDLLVGSADGSIAVLPGTTTIEAPLNVVAVGAPDQVIVSWSANPERGLAGYRVHRSTTAGGPYTVMATVPADTTSWRDLAVSTGTTYSYVVTAYSFGGESDLSAEVSAEPELLEALTLSPLGPQTVLVGETLEFTVTGGFAPFAWYATNPLVGTVDADGVFTAVGRDPLGESRVLVFDSLANGAISGILTVPFDSEPDALPDWWELENELAIGTDDAAEDPDADDATNLEEYLGGTDPHIWDTDGDGLPDGWELDPRLADPNGDPDEDGLTNALERSVGTDPLDDDRVKDDDGDGMDNAWEVLHRPAVDYTLADADEDPDGDTFINLAEYWNRTEPGVDNDDLDDADGDGLPDAWEAFYGLPTDEDDAPDDPDGDGFPNALEYRSVTSPLQANRRLPDGDGDGMPDRYERAWGLWALVGTDGSASGDPDGDRLPNGIEYRDGTPPVVDNDDLADTDEDGLPDLWERAFGRDPETADPTADADEDDRSDYLEYRAGTHPDTHDSGEPDTDEDGMPDWWERAWDFDPADPDDRDANADSDNTKNVVEYLDATDPRRPHEDTDEDGLDDRWEHGWGLTVGFDDSQENPDNDLQENWEEFQAGTNPTRLDPYELDIAPRNPLVLVGETLPLTVLGGVAPFTWTVDDDTVAGISQAGLVTGRALGLAQVTVTDGNGFQAVAWVRVTYRYLLEPGALLLLVGEQGAFAAQAPAVAPVTWRSLDPSVAQVDGLGTVTAVGFGETLIVATDANDVEAFGTVRVSYELTLEPEAPHVLVGEAVELTVVGPAEPPLAWESLDESVATVDEAGLVTGVAWGQTTIVLTDGNGVQAAVGVSVGYGFRILPDAPLVLVGDTLTLTTEGATAPVTWASEDEAIATVAAATGEVTGVAYGVVKVWATDANGVTASADVRVDYAIAIDPPYVELEVDGTATLQPVGAVAPLAWDSQDEAVATVSATGQVTAVAPGVTVVTLTDANGKEARAVVVVWAEPVVEPPEPGPLRCVTAPMTLTVGDEAWVVAEGGTLPYVNIAVDAAAVLDAEPELDATSGQPTGAVQVTALAPGVASVEFEDSDGATAVCDVTVVEAGDGPGPGPQPEDLAVFPETAQNVYIGATLWVYATGGTEPYTWTTSDAAVATVDGGAVTGVAEGTATITVTDAEGASQFVAVTVLPLPITTGSGGGGCAAAPGAAASPAGAAGGAAGLALLALALLFTRRRRA